MEIFTPYIFTAVFAAAIVIDLWAHKKRGLFRKRADKVFLGALVALLGISALAAFLSGNAERYNDTPGSYLAYQYLLADDPDSADCILSEDGDMSPGSRKLIKIMTDAKAGRDDSLYFDSSEYLDEKGHDAGQTHIVEELNAMAKTSLNDGVRSDSDITKLIRSSYEILGIEETDALQRLYEADRNIRSGSAGNISSSEVDALLQDFEDSDLVRKIAISCYLMQEDFESAEAISEELIETNESEANYVLYTDVLAQETYAEETEKLAETTDEEVRPLVDRAIASYEEAMSANGSETDRIETNTEKAEDSYDQARDVFYQRYLNYLELKKNQGWDRDGIISLQIVKLRILKEDYDTALDGMNALLSRIERLDNTSPIREDLILLRNCLDEPELSGKDPANDGFRKLCSAARTLFDNASCMIFAYGSDNINDRAYKVLSAMLYCDQPSVQITGVNASRYPKVEADFSMNIMKQNIFGGYGEYYGDDFIFTDEEEPLDDCKLTAALGHGKRSAAMVLDLQNGELSENELDDLKTALYTLTDENRCAEKYALVNSTSFIQSEVTDRDTDFRYAIRSINTQYAVSAYTCLNTAMDVLEKDGKAEDRVIFYITNGSTLSEEEMAGAANRASQSGIRICAMNFKDGEDTICDTLVKASDGFVIPVSYYEQAVIFTGRLADLMNNRYQADFTAVTNTEQAGIRRFSLTLTDQKISDSAEYAGGGE